MFGFSPGELMVVGVIAVLLFGRNLPSVARQAGKSLTEFRRGMNDLQHDFREAMRESEEAVTSAAEGTQGRLPGPPHDDSADDAAYDPYCEDSAEESEVVEADADPDPSIDPDADRREETQPA